MSLSREERHRLIFRRDDLNKRKESLYDDKRRYQIQIQRIQERMSFVKNKFDRELMTNEINGYREAIRGVDDSINQIKRELGDISRQLKW